MTERENISILKETKDKLNTIKYPDYITSYDKKIQWLLDQTEKKQDEVE